MTALAAAAIQFADVNYLLPSGQPLLRNINLTLHSGSVTALLGRSGSGKTTLLRMVNGLVQPTSGRVLVDGKSTAEDVLALRRSIGYVIQETGLFPHRRIGSNVGMPLEIAGTAKEAAPYHAAIEHVMHQVGLEPERFLDRYPWSSAEASVNEPVWLAHWLRILPSCSWMNPSARSILSPARRCKPCSAICSRQSGKPSFSSRMIFPKRSTWPSVSSFSKRARSSRIFLPERCTPPKTPMSAAISKLFTQLCLPALTPHSHQHLRRRNRLAQMPLRVSAQ